MADVRMAFTPRDRLELTCVLEGNSSFVGCAILADRSWDGRIALTERGVDLHVMCSAAGGKDGKTVFSPLNSNISVLPATQRIAKAIFHVFNFPEFFGLDDCILATGELPRKSMRRLGRVMLSGDGWLITIAATDSTKDRVADLEANGGFVITHVGSVTREDGGPFSSDALDELLTCLQYFLSFAFGRWVGLAFPVGFDPTGGRVFEQWGIRRAADGPWNGSYSWFERAPFGNALAGVSGLSVVVGKQPLARAAEPCDLLVPRRKTTDG